MKIHYNTQSVDKPVDVEANSYKVFVAKNAHTIEISRKDIETGETKTKEYWEYDLYEYEPSEYVQILQKKYDDQQVELLDTQMALCDLYEAMING